MGANIQKAALLILIFSPFCTLARTPVAEYFPAALTLTLPQ